MKKSVPESRKSKELAILKCLTGGQLTPIEAQIVSKLSESDLYKSFGCDMIMVEKIKMHGKMESNRHRAQELMTRTQEIESVTKKKKKSKSINESLFQAREMYKTAGLSDEEIEERMKTFSKVPKKSQEGALTHKFVGQIAKDAVELYKIVQTSDDLPLWCFQKIVEAQKDLAAIKAYLTDGITAEVA